MAFETIDKIIHELEQVKQRVERFKVAGKVPDIEKDIIRQKLRNIYEFIDLIEPEKSEKNTTSLPGTSFTQPAQSIENTREQQEVSDLQKSAVIQPEPEVASTIENTTVHPDHQDRFENTASETSTRQEILAEKFKQEKKFINEAMAQYVNNFDLSRKLQNQPIHDIFSAIGLNDKFLFIRELFNNNTEKYQRTLEHINKATSFNDAIKFIDHEFTWNFDQPEVGKFLELVRRRHSEDKE